jgi:hypothetical protein
MSTRRVGDVLEDFWRFQLFQRQHHTGNGPEYRAGAAFLVEGVDPEAGDVA